MKISQKLTIGLLSIVVLLGMGGIFGLIASGKILNIYKGAEDQFGPIVTTTNEILYEVDRSESFLIRFLMLHREDLYEDYLHHYRQMDKKIMHLKGLIESDSPIAAIVEKIDSTSQMLRPLALEMKKDHDHGSENDFVNYTPKKNEVLLEEYTQRVQEIQEQGRQIIQLQTEFLQQQEVIQMAASIDNMTKRMEHHLNMYLVLNNKEDHIHFNTIYDSLMEILQTYHGDEAKGFALKSQEKILNIYNLGKYLISASQDDRKISGTFNIDKYQNSLQEFYRANKRLGKDIETLTRVNTDLLRAKHDEGIKQARLIRVSIFMVTFFALVCALFVSFKLRRSISAPLAKLQETAKLYGQGKFDTNITIDSEDELGELAKAFNQMASNLRESMVSKSFVIDIIESMPETLLVLDPNLTIKMVNKATLNLLGYTESELIGASISKVFYDDKPVEGIHSLNFTKNKSISGMETTYVTKGNRKISVLFSVSALLGPQNQVEEFICSGKDITVQKQADNKLRQSLKQLSDIMFALDQSAILLITDEKGVITHVNDLYCSLTQYSKEELIGMQNGITNSETYSESLTKNIWETISKGEVWKGDIYSLKKDGTNYWLSNTIVPFLDETGKPFQYMSICFDITSRKIAESEMIRAKATAEEHNKAKSSFLAKMSHELRTPLNAILGYCELLDEEFVDQELKEYSGDLSKIHGAGSHLLALINDILDLSKVEAGKMDLFIEEFSLGTIGEEVRATVEPLANKNQNEFILQCSDFDITMEADFIKTKQILINLLSNACKFTKNGSITLDISVDKTGPRDFVLYRIIDTGIGISEDQINKIFEAFTQADSSTTRKYEGTGLGLAITSKFCELMSGTIEVESEKGKGSCFEVKIPLKVDPVPVEGELTENTHGN